MSKSNNDGRNNGTTTTSSKRLTVYSIKTGSHGAAIWVKAGSAFINRDGSLNVYLDVLPLDGKLHIRETPARVQAPEEGEGEPAVAN